MNYFLGLESQTVIIASSIVILYSTFGGIKAVTYTDVLQFFTFGFVIPIWNHFHASSLTFNDALQNSLFDYNKAFNFENPNLLSLILLMLYFCIPNISPPAFQRISMGKNVNQVKKAFLIAALLLLLVMLAMVWIPFLILNINPNLEAGHITTLYNRKLHTTWFKMVDNNRHFYNGYVKR